MTPASEIILRRRTVKPAMMSDRDVDRSILEEMLMAANWAPTHGMTQPWRFRVFTGNARSQLGEFLSSTYRSVVPPEEFKQKKFDSFRVNPSLASAVIAIGMKRQEQGKITELDELLAVGCAVQNMHLVATSHGVGGFWSTNVAAVSSAMRDYIGLTGDDRALGLFYVGYPKASWPESKRDSIKDKVTWVN